MQSFYDSYDTQIKISERLAKLYKNKKVEENQSFILRIIERYNIFDYIKKINKEKLDTLKSWLQKAGMRSSHSVAYYLVTKVILCTATFVVSLIIVIGFKVTDNLMIQLIAPLGVMYIIYMLVDAHIQSRIQDRYKSIEKGIPDALDLLVICTEAGMGIDHALRRIGMEMESSYPILSEELKVTVVELGVSSDRTQVFQNLMARVEVPQMQAIINSILQSSEFGTPISTTLQTLSEEYRKERMLAAESRASRLPALMTLPLMFFILPTLFIVLIGPVIIKALNS